MAACFLASIFCLAVRVTLASGMALLVVAMVFESGLKLGIELFSLVGTLRMVGLYFLNTGFYRLFSISVSSMNLCMRART